MKNLNILTINRLSTIMLFTLLAITFSSFTGPTPDRPKPKKRKRIRITKVQNPNIKNENIQSRSNNTAFMYEYIGTSNLECANSFIYEIKNDTDAAVYDVTLSITQGNSSISSLSTIIPYIASGGLYEVSFYASLPETGRQLVSFSVSGSASPFPGGVGMTFGFSEILTGQIGNCELNGSSIVDEVSKKSN